MWGWKVLIEQKLLVTLLRQKRLQVLFLRFGFGFGFGFCFRFRFRLRIPDSGFSIRPFSCAYIEIWSTCGVWSSRALKRLELLSAAPWATLTSLSSFPSFLGASYLDMRMLIHKPNVKCNCKIANERRDGFPKKIHNVQKTLSQSHTHPKMPLLFCLIHANRYVICK